MNASTDSVNSRTSPARRASQPVSGTAIAEATEYDEITHVPSLVATPRLPEIVGTATFAIDVSSTSMNVPSASPIVSSASVPPDSGAGSAEREGEAGAVAAMCLS
ncbi:putative transport domain protein [Burkholderia pseudomallei MSHR3709]|nr:putative transport domain protein [Burkholderia pseudomallei MSHR3709]